MFPLFLKPPGRGGLVFKEFVFEVVDMDLGEQVDLLEILKIYFFKGLSLLFLASQTQKEHSIEHLLSCFIVVLMVRFLIPKLLKQHKIDLEEYPLGPTTSANRSIFQLLFSVTLFRGIY